MNRLLQIIFITSVITVLVGCGRSNPEPAQREIIPSKFSIKLSETVVGPRYRQEICARYKQHPEIGADTVTELLAAEDDVKYIYSIEFDRAFSVEDLKELNAFFSSELGEKYLNTMVTIDNRLLEKVNEVAFGSKKQKGNTPIVKPPQSKSQKVFAY